jgi:hypothetical protein
VDPSTHPAGRPPQPLEGVAWADAVALGEDADGLLDHDPRCQGMFELHDRQP